MGTNLTGAWQLVSGTHNGLAVFTDTHFNITWAEKNRAKFKTDEPTDMESDILYPLGEWRL